MYSYEYTIYCDVHEYRIRRKQKVSCAHPAPSFSRNQNQNYSNSQNATNLTPRLTHPQDLSTLTRKRHTILPDCHFNFARLPDCQTTSDSLFYHTSSNTRLRTLTYYLTRYCIQYFKVFTQNSINNKNMYPCVLDDQCQSVVQYSYIYNISYSQSTRTRSLALDILVQSRLDQSTQYTRTQYTQRRRVYEQTKFIVYNTSVRYESKVYTVILLKKFPTGTQYCILLHSNRLDYSTLPHAGLIYLSRVLVRYTESTLCEYQKTSLRRLRRLYRHSLDQTTSTLRDILH